MGRGPRFFDDEGEGGHRAGRRRGTRARRCAKRSENKCGWASTPTAVGRRPKSRSRPFAAFATESEIYFAEQPLPPGDHDALAEVRCNVPVPIIADESVYTLEDAKMLARVQAADVFSIYVGKAGGIAPAHEIAEFAHSVGIRCTIGSNLELGVGSAAMIHLALSARGVDADTYPCDIIGPMFYVDDVLAEGPQISGGSAWLGDRPGLGVALDDEKIEKYRVRSC